VQSLLFFAPLRALRENKTLTDREPLYLVRKGILAQSPQRRKENLEEEEKG